MGVLFDRRCELHVFTTGQKTIIKDLDMEFDILATSDSKPNTATITVFNLNETNRSLFSEDTLGVEYYAGYGDDIGIIFQGSWDPENSVVHHVKEGVDWVTTFQTGDGFKEFMNSFFDKTYSAGTPVKTILSDVAAVLGLPVFLDFDDGIQMIHGGWYSGKAKDVLDDVVADYGLSWSIQWGTVEVVAKGSPPSNDSQAILLTPSTGLVGRPTITEKGVECQTLMIYTIRPTRLIKIEGVIPDTPVGDLLKLKKEKPQGDPAQDPTGVYIVDRVRYGGDNMGGGFGCTIESDRER